MRQAHHTLEVKTRGRGMHKFTGEVAGWLSAQKPRDGLLTLFIQHTSASLLVQENADPDVCADLDRFLSKLVKDGDPMFAHEAEGPDDMPSHVRAALTQTQLSIPVIGGELSLGTWQGLYLFEHRHAAHTRRVVLHYLGT
ncbi:MAG: secondary thiamine-phosphate synthase enzyme YjbQ [Myxococcaceae bacterium]